MKQTRFSNPFVERESQAAAGISSNDQTTRELPARTHYRCQNCDTLNRIGRVCICLAQPKNLK
jgi:hypothetical protein